MRVLLLLQFWWYNAHSFRNTDCYFRRLGLSDPFGQYSIETSAEPRPQFRHLAASTSSDESEFLRTTGEGALRIVQQLGHLTKDKPLLSENYFGKRKIGIGSIFSLVDDDEERSPGIYSTNQKQLSTPDIKAGEKQVWEALANLESDMQLLDRLAGQRPQLSALELFLLSTAVLTSACSPFILSGRLTEFLSPVAAAFTASIGIAAEYTGKVAVADGKEVAASAIQCAAEAEGFLANAERAKAITPLCVGVATVAATLALLVPVLLDTLGIGNNLQLVTEIYLLCPLVAVLAAAVAGLAVQEVTSFCNQAIGVGNRRFARSGLVGRTWLSSTELVERKCRNTKNKWKSFSVSVLPAPLLGALCPGALPTKTIVVAALAAAQTAFYLTRSEYILSRATDAAALKARSAAVCDTYANQGARSAAILPFTSALAGLCAAATAAIVELPFIETLAHMGGGGVVLEAVAVTVFPALSALFSAAASVSKARCEVDAEAVMQSASTMALPYENEKDDPILNPIKGVRELIRLTLSNSVQERFRRFLRFVRLENVWYRLSSPFRRKRNERRHRTA